MLVCLFVKLSEISLWKMGKLRIMYRWDVIMDHHIYV